MKKRFRFWKRRITKVLPSDLIDAVHMALMLVLIDLDHQLIDEHHQDNIQS